MRNGIIMPKEIGELWEAINAFGGRAVTEYDAGADNAIGRCLAEIESRFEHVHVASPNDNCALCGLYLSHDIHTRIKR